MADNPAEQTPDKDKFAPKNVTEDPKANDDHHADFHGRDLPRGSEPATRDHARNRG
jgi:hypothetical protein